MRPESGARLNYGRDEAPTPRHQFTYERTRKLSMSEWREKEREREEEEGREKSNRAGGKR